MNQNILTITGICDETNETKSLDFDLDETSINEAVDYFKHIDIVAVRVNVKGDFVWLDIDEHEFMAHYNVTN